MTKMSTLQATDELAGIISAMHADSYALSVVEATADELSLRIDALDGACQDCLSPPSVMTGVVSGALGGRYAPGQISIRYPGAT